MKQPKYKAVVYDVDGTAVDPRYDIDALQETCIELFGREAGAADSIVFSLLTLAINVLYFVQLRIAKVNRETR